MMDDQPHIHLTREQLFSVLNARSARIAVLKAEVAHLELVIHELARELVSATTSTPEAAQIETVIDIAEQRVRQAEDDSAAPTG